MGQSSTEAESQVSAATAVLAEMERHGDPGTRLYYGGKLRTALGVTGPLVCVCGSCKHGAAQ